MEEEIKNAENVVKKAKTKKSKRIKKYSSEVEDMQQTLRGMWRRVKSLENEGGENRSYQAQDGSEQLHGAEPVQQVPEEELRSGAEPKLFSCKRCREKGTVVQLERWPLVLHCLLYTSPSPRDS